MSNYGLKHRKCILYYTWLEHKFVVT